MAKLLLTVDLITETQVHIGSGQSSTITDAMFYRRVDGRIIIPGSSIAGALRSRANRLFPAFDNTLCIALLEDAGKTVCSCTACKLFGNINPDTDYQGMLTSKLIIHDGEISLPASTSIRDGVGISRTTGSADSEAAAKYDYETLPRGTMIRIRMECNGLTEEEECYLAALLAEIFEGRICLGGKSSRGLGRVNLQEIAAQKLPTIEEDLDKFLVMLSTDDWFNIEGTIIENWFQDRLDEARSLLALSTNHELVEETGNISKDPRIMSGFLSITGIMNFEGPFLTKDYAGAITGCYDAVPLMSYENGKEMTFVPGSTFRGIIRFQAERIIRTIAMLKGQKTTSAACNPFEKVDKGEVKTDCCDKKTCLACRLFGSTELGSRLRVSDAWQEQEVTFFVQDHLAVDRFTGGGSDGKKFDAVGVYKPAYRFEILLEDPQPWEIGCLLLTLRDIHDGLIVIGSGGSKGYGEVKFEQSIITVVGEVWSSLAVKQSGVLTAREIPLEEAYQTPEAKDYILAFNEEILQTKQGGSD